MRILYFITGIVLLSSACSEGAEPTKDQSKGDLSEQKVFADSELIVSIDGMVCEHGCGGTIRKALKETGAVERVSFDFEDERPSNTATIKYDSQKTNKKEIISIISKLNDGQFDVKELAKKDNDSNVIEENTAGSEEESSVSSIDRDFEIPNIFELLSGLIL